MTSRRGSTILILFLVGATIVWFWYDGKLPFLRGRSFGLNILPGDLSGFSQKTSQAIKNFQTKGGAALKDVFKMAAEKPKEIASNVAADAKKSAVESFKNQVAETFGIAVAPGGVGAAASAAKNVAIVRPINQGLSLSIEADASPIKYSISWGDGVGESGNLEAKQQNKVDHIWSRAGDYSVNVEIVENGQTKTFMFPVKILK